MPTKSKIWAEENEVHFLQHEMGNFLFFYFFLFTNTLNTYITYIFTVLHYIALVYLLHCLPNTVLLTLHYTTLIRDTVCKIRYLSYLHY